VSGDTTEDALARLDEDVLQHDPSTVIVFLGGNDALYRYFEQIENAAEEQGLLEQLQAIIVFFLGSLFGMDALSEEETFNNIETIVEEIQSTGAVVILVGFSGEPFNSNLSDEYQAVAAETGAILVPNALDGIIGNLSLMSDLVHPNDQGYDILANRIYGALACVS
jgi:lysophospholipase L1-like esterase